jgi:hypothetical protein
MVGRINASDLRLETILPVILTDSVKLYGQFIPKLFEYTVLNTKQVDPHKRIKLMMPLYIIKKYVLTKKSTQIDIKRCTSQEDDIPEVPEYVKIP